MKCPFCGDELELTYPNEEKYGHKSDVRPETPKNILSCPLYWEYLSGKTWHFLQGREGYVLKLERELKEEKSKIP